MRYGEEHIENMDGQDPTENVRMPPEVMELKLEDEQKQKRNTNHGKSIRFRKQ